MRKEIKFRGQESENKKWVYGFYQEYPKGYVHIQNEYNDWFPVLPDTVGQYIGIKDKNGREIYEGDIVKRKVFNDYIIGQVVWFDIGFCGFQLKYRNGYYPMGKSEHTGISDCDEVIGNVHENADLLREAE